MSSFVQVGLVLTNYIWAWPFAPLFSVLHFWVHQPLAGTHGAKWRQEFGMKEGEGRKNEKVEFLFPPLTFPLAPPFPQPGSHFEGNESESLKELGRRPLQKNSKRACLFDRQTHAHVGLGFPPGKRGNRQVAFITLHWLIRVLSFPFIIDIVCKCLGRKKWRKGLR